MPSSGLDANYHLLRVRVKKHVFYRLQELAMEETHASGEYTTVSDLVRCAIFDWLLAWDGEGMKKPPSERIFIPSGLAAPPVAGIADDDDDDVDVEVEIPDDE